MSFGSFACAILEVIRIRDDQLGALGNKLINNLLEMQALTEELKIETLALVVSCTNAHELEQAMLNACA
jgi:hypothetical protein